jgi:Repeat of unknown function (DUF5648)
MQLVSLGSKLRFSILIVAGLLLTACGSGDGQSELAADSDALSNSIHLRAVKDVSQSPIKFSVAPYPTVYRFAKISTGAYFYTGSEDEAATIVKDYPDFRFEGHAFSKQLTGASKPVYRFANLQNLGYFYTGSQEERDIIIASMPHMRYEGTTFSVAATSLAYADPVYRLANLNNGAYLYTQSTEERDYAVSLGVWRSEGTTFSAEAAVPNGQSVVPRNLLISWYDGTQILSNNYDLVAGWFFPFKPLKRYSLLRTAKTIAPTLPSNLAGNIGVGGCTKPLSSFVIEQENTITYSGADVSADDHTEAAMHVEQAALSTKVSQGVSSSTIGFVGEKLITCVQNEEPSGRPAVQLAGSSTHGLIITSSATTFFQRQARTDTTLRNQWTYVQKTYERALLHEMTHAFFSVTAYFAGAEFLLDTWLEEGFAKHAEWGRLIIRKDYLMGELTRSNPLNSTYDSNGLNYDVASAIVEYLTSSLGANNSMQSIKAINDELGRKAEEYRLRCGFVVLPPGCESISSLGNKAFIAAFEANMKEKDGTPMRLYSGTNNLKDTLVQRMQLFWQ